MILADTSVWIDFFRRGNPLMEAHLRNDEILIHSFVALELALGSLAHRLNTLAELDRLPRAQEARTQEVRSLIEAKALYSRGIGLTDAHLIASCLLTAGTQLWTLDVRLASTAQFAGVRIYTAVVP